MATMNIEGVGAPSTSLAGAIGCIYTDTNTGQKYRCIAIHTCTTMTGLSKEYIWEVVEEEGGGGGTVTNEQIAEEVKKYLEEHPASGANGKSAYDIWLEQGNTGTEDDFVASLKGATGAQGPEGPKGDTGATGKSAYQYARDGGYTGTEAEFAARLAFLAKGVSAAYVDSDGKLVFSDLPADREHIAYCEVNGELVKIGVLTVGEEEIPDPEAKDYTVTFVADGATVAEIGYNIGDTIEEPAVPAKEGYNMGIWEDYDLTSGGNITVNAKYLNNMLITYGYETGKRIQVNDGSIKEQEGTCVSGFIEIPNVGKYFYIYDVELSSATAVNNVAFYDADKNKVAAHSGTANAFTGSVKVGQVGGKNYYYLKANSWSGTENAKYFRFSCASITDKSIVTYDSPL